MKRLFSKSNQYVQTLGFFIVVFTFTHCQNCQDIQSNNASAYLKVVFFLDNAQTSSDSVRITSRSPAAALTSGTTQDTLDTNCLVFLLPSNTSSQTYEFGGTYTDEANQIQSFSRKITVDFNRKISVLRPDCGVKEDITITNVIDANNASLVMLSGTGIDTTQAEGNVKIFLK